MCSYYSPFLAALYHAAPMIPVAAVIIGGFWFLSRSRKP